jgi:hypothetical protein
MSTTTKDGFLNHFVINSADYTSDVRSVCLRLELHNPVWSATTVSVKTSFDKIIGVISLGNTAAISNIYTDGTITDGAVTITSNLSTTSQPFLLVGELVASDV